MSKFNELRKKNNEGILKIDNSNRNIKKIAKESHRVSEVAHNAESIIKDIDKKFSEKTKLNKLDIKFLFFATALQCARQYIIEGFVERETDQKAARKVKEKEKEVSSRIGDLYHPSLEEIINNPVPYDAIFGGKDFDLGLGGNEHRFKTLGHDPILGWIFGTANILTSTITVTPSFKSYHVKTGYTVNNHARDKIYSKASTLKVFNSTYDRLFNEGTEGKKAVAVALCKQCVHIKSDMYSKKGLPIPIISSVSPKLAEELADYGIDMGNLLIIGKQASISMLINSLIAMIHYMFYDESKYENRSLYEVKTRKILSYSNVIASTSNIIYVAISDDLKKLDVGGMMVTIHRLITDTKFINDIKYEFIKNEFEKLVQGEEYDS